MMTLLRRILGEWKDRHARRRNELLAERNKLLNEGRYEAANQLESRWLSANPRDAALHHKAAWTLSAMHKPEAALEHLQKAIALDPLNAGYHEALSKAHGRAAARIRATRLREYKDNEIAVKAEQVRMIEVILATALPHWIHATSQSPELRFEQELLSHKGDSVPEWIQFARAPLDQGAIVNFGRIGRFVVGNHRQVIQKRLSRKIPWELPIAVLLMELASRCDPNSLIIDVGANVGTLTVPLAKTFPGKVLAFEPVKHNYDDLLRNISLNRLNNVTAINEACSREPGMGMMGRLQENNPGAARLDTSVAGETRVTTVDLVAERRPVALIKMDVEGHEPDVIAGASQTLMRDRPLVLSELTSFQADNIMAALRAFDYDCIKVHQRDWLFFPRAQESPERRSLGAKLRSRLMSALARFRHLLR